MATSDNSVANNAATTTAESSTATTPTVNSSTESTPVGSKPTPSKKAKTCKPNFKAPSCVSPQQVFLIASSFSAFLASKLTQKELQTLINIFSLLVANLAAIVRQQELCEGYVIPPEEILGEIDLV